MGRRQPGASASTVRPRASSKASRQAPVVRRAAAPRDSAAAAGARTARRDGRQGEHACDPPRAQAIACRRWASPPTRACRSTSAGGSCSSWSTELFARHSFAELSMAAHRARGRHLEGAALPLLPEQARASSSPRFSRPPRRWAAARSPTPTCRRREALAASLDAFLGWIEENELAYRKLMESAGSVPEVGDADRRGAHRHVRAHPRRPRRRRRPAAELRAAARAWLWFIDGAILDWLDHRDLERVELRRLPARFPGRLRSPPRATSSAPAVCPRPSAPRHPRPPSSRSAPRPSRGR